LELTIGAGAEEIRMMGYQVVEKIFKDRFSRFDAIWCVTNSYPASQPRCCNKCRAYYVARVKRDGLSIAAKYYL